MTKQLGGGGVGNAASGLTGNSGNVLRRMSMSPA